MFVKGPRGNVWTPEAVGMALLALGLFALIAAVVNHYNDLKPLRAAGLQKKFSLPASVASVLAIVGCMALISAAVGQ